MKKYIGVLLLVLMPMITECMRAGGRRGRGARRPCGGYRMQRVSKYEKQVAGKAMKSVHDNLSDSTGDLVDSAKSIETLNASLLTLRSTGITPMQQNILRGKRNLILRTMDSQEGIDSNLAQILFSITQTIDTAPIRDS